MTPSIYRAILWATGMAVAAYVAMSLAAANAHAGWSWGYARTVAYSYWAPDGRRPPGCPEGIKFSFQDLSSYGDGRAADAKRVTDGWPACEAEVDVKFALHAYWREACAVLAHEYGHMWGLGHSDDINSVMYPFVAAVPRICVTRGPRYQADTGLRIIP